jgi:alternate signal-mediated exported protein
VRKRSIIICASLLAVAMAVVGGRVTYGLWEAEASSTGGVITAGDMHMVISEVTWATGCASGDATTLSAIPATPGDTLQVKAQVATNFVGDNLAVSLSVDLTGTTTPNAMWHVEDPTGQIVPASGNAPLTFPLTLPVTNGQHTWTVVVSVPIPGSGPIWSDPASATPSPMDFGTLILTANQVRCGGGFVNECGGS